MHIKPHSLWVPGNCALESGRKESLREVRYLPKVTQQDAGRSISEHFVLTVTHFQDCHVDQVEEHIEELGEAAGVRVIVFVLHVLCGCTERDRKLLSE